MTNGARCFALCKDWSVQDDHLSVVSYRIPGRKTELQRVRIGPVYPDSYGEGMLEADQDATPRGLHECHNPQPHQGICDRSVLFML